LTPRTKKPFHKNRTEEAKKRRQRSQTNLHAKSQLTGIQITLGNIAGWERIMDDFEKKQEAQRTQVYTSMPFFNWLKDKKIDSKLCCFEFKEGYRFANSEYGPLTIVGSISDGGRFNIGGAQMSSTFPTITKSGALYLASTKDCAMVEAAKPIGKHKLYKVTSSETLKLWDLKRVIKQLDYPNLLSEIYASHGERIWAYQKIPTISQILAVHLRNQGGDGLVFNSTMCKEDLNVALFYKDDSEVKSKLKAREVKFQKF